MLGTKILICLFLLAMAVSWFAAALVNSSSGRNKLVAQRLQTTSTGLTFGIVCCSLAFLVAGVGMWIHLGYVLFALLPIVAVGGLVKRLMRNSRR